jgi:hypothetical protein
MKFFKDEQGARDLLFDMGQVVTLFETAKTRYIEKSAEELMYRMDQIMRNYLTDEGDSAMAGYPGDIVDFYKEKLDA